MEVVPSQAPGVQARFPWIPSAAEHAVAAGRGTRWRDVARRGRGRADPARAPEGPAVLGVRGSRSRAGSRTRSTAGSPGTGTGSAAASTASTGRRGSTSTTTGAAGRRVAAPFPLVSRFRLVTSAPSERSTARASSSSSVRRSDWTPSGAVPPLRATTRSTTSRHIAFCSIPPTSAATTRSSAPAARARTSTSKRAPPGTCVKQNVTAPARAWPWSVTAVIVSG